MVQMQTDKGKSRPEFNASFSNIRKYPEIGYVTVIKNILIGGERVIALISV